MGALMRQEGAGAGAEGAAMYDARPPTGSAPAAASAASSRRTGASNVSSGVFGALSTPAGASAAASAAATPRSPTNPLKREQPLGGRGLLASGFGGALDSRESAGSLPVGIKVLSHARSNVMFG